MRIIYALMAVGTILLILASSTLIEFTLGIITLQGWLVCSYLSYIASITARRTQTR